MKVMGLAKAFGIKTLFKDVSFEVKKGAKVGLVGANGAGKTTLFKILMGKMESDAGQVQLGRERVGYVEQQSQGGGGTLYEELKTAFADILALEEERRALEVEMGQGDDEARLTRYGKLMDAFERLGGYEVEATLKKIVYGLGFSDADLEKPSNAFSGGQRTRIALAKALMREPDILLLDEPTNHLDIERIEWLEGYLRSYRGGVLIISHDRFFLDKVVGEIVELEHGVVTHYEGNYSRYIALKEEHRRALLSAYEKQQEHIKKTEEYIRRYRAGIKAKQARGRESQLKRLERITLLPETAAFNYFAFHPPAMCAEKVCDLEEISAGYGSVPVFSKLSLGIRRGEGIGLIGPNGAGKTTILKVLVGELEPTAGRVQLGNRVKVGYFSQQHEGLHLDRTLVEELNYEYGIEEEQARKYLGAFLFRGDEVFRLIGDLSGGEQSRLAFLKLMLTGANFLVLDEPTNHLDIPAKEAIEEALMTFPGTFLCVSHDRYFLDKVASRTVELQDGVLTSYEGSYSYYRMKKEMEEEERRESEMLDASHGIASKDKSQDVTTASVAKSQSEASGVERRSTPPKTSNTYHTSSTSKTSTLSEEKKQEMLSRIEAEIAMNEAELKGIEYEMNKLEVQQDAQKSANIALLYEKKEEELARRYAKWEELLDG